MTVGLYIVASNQLTEAKASSRLLYVEVDNLNLDKTMTIFVELGKFALSKEILCRASKFRASRVYIEQVSSAWSKKSLHRARKVYIEQGKSIHIQQEKST